MTGPTLKVEDLTVSYSTAETRVQALRSVSLEISPGETYGIVGESGSGKSTLSLAVMGYLPPNGRLESGRVIFQGRDLAACTRSEMQQIWGAQMALVPQEPFAALNPSLRIGSQLEEVLERHLELSAHDRRRRALELLERVQLGDPQRVFASYPHQISGGQQQRALIAMALSTSPALLVLDEPTTGLDTTTQAAVLELIAGLMAEFGMAALYVTHNLGVVANVCDRVAVLYAGELLEDGPTQAIYSLPLHPYTHGLLDSIPRLGESKDAVRLRPIAGSIPALQDLPVGCIFRPRCPLAIDICTRVPPAYASGPDRSSRCHRWEEIARGEVSARQPLPAAPPQTHHPDAGDPLLELRAVQVEYAASRGLRDLRAGRRTGGVRVVNGVDLQVDRDSTLGLVGESGSGKTTLARSVMGLTPRSAGGMLLHGRELAPGLPARSRATRAQMQIVIQNPAEALNPYLTVGESLRRPLQRLLGLPRDEAELGVRKLLESVHLQPEYARRFPSELSGGEKQRVVIARAFSSQPDLLVADEPVSSLDVSVQASILNLLSEMQAGHGSGMLFISHDLAVVGFLADAVAVMYLGSIMEQSPVEALFSPPHHPYTEALLAAIPRLDPARRRPGILLEGELPGAAQVPTGCPFHTRCPRFLGQICVTQAPPWQTSDDGKRIYCHIPLHELERSQGAGKASPPGTGSHA